MNCVLCCLDKDMADQNSDFLLKGLNEAQCEAVSAPLQNMLIVAGAGTGKTRVLVSRISWLLKVENIPPRSIMAVTFTNKAALEMRERIGALVGEDTLRSMWTSTFHSICLRILRSYAHQAGLTPGFSVLDTEGQKLLIKRIEQDLGISIKDYKPAQLAGAISRLKEKGLRAADFLKKYQSTSPLQCVLAKVYPVYEDSCRREDLVDFSELLLRAMELLRDHADIQALQHRRFKEILVDEFQDTNTPQYELLRLIAGPNAHVLAVGDDDQSIYGWRGADFTNMKRFSEEYPDVKIISLMQNYRSKQNILDIANTLISGNDNRLVEKSLHGVSDAGDKVEIFHCRSGYFESINVGGAIESLIKEGVKASDIAVLYRNNSLSAPVEAELSNRGIPYAVYGGLKFFDRAEVQDALAYLRVLLNDADDTALLRIINVPSRKVGPKVVESLRRIAADRHCSVMQAVQLIFTYGSESSAPRELKSLAKKLSTFKDLMDSLNTFRKENTSLSDLVKEVITTSGLYEMYKLKDEKEERGQFDNQRHLNLEQLVSNAAEFENRALSGALDVQNFENVQEADKESVEQEHDGSKNLLLDFLSSVSLSAGTELSGEGSNEIVPNTVNLMTIHSSKGLEFKYVFLIAFDNGILPSQRANDNRDTSEERRLAYVGITRAINKLFITYSDYRVMYGSQEPTGPSVFLREVVSDYSGSKDKPFEIRV